MRHGSSVAGVADPGRGAERLSERFFGRGRMWRSGFGSGFSVAGVADPRAARYVKDKWIRSCGRAPRRTFLRTCFWVRLECDGSELMRSVRQAKTGFSIDLKCDQHVK